MNKPIAIFQSAFLSTNFYIVDSLSETGVKVSIIKSKNGSSKYRKYISDYDLYYKKEALIHDIEQEKNILILY